MWLCFSAFAHGTSGSGVFSGPGSVPSPALKSDLYAWFAHSFSGRCLILLGSSCALAVMPPSKTDFWFCAAHGWFGGSRCLAGGRGLGQSRSCRDFIFQSWCMALPPGLAPGELEGAAGFMLKLPPWYAGCAPSCSETRALPLFGGKPWTSLWPGPQPAQSWPILFIQLFFQW